MIRKGLNLLKKYKFVRNVCTRSEIFFLVSSIGFIGFHHVMQTAQIFLTRSLHIHHSHLLLPAGLPNYILCLHRTDVNKFLLVGQHWHVHVWGVIEERQLWVCPCFSSSVLQIYFNFFKKVFLYLTKASSIWSEDFT